MQLTLNIQRFNPLADTAPYFKEYNVTWEKQDTVLDALIKAWHQDPSISFRRSCRSSICGSCAMFIEDGPRLACQTLVGDIAAGGCRITLRPLPGFRLEKDLVVDLNPFFDSLKQVLPWVLTRPDHGGLVSPEDSQRIENPATCILCGICDAGIQSGGSVRPAALVKNIRMAVDPRDALGARRMEIAGLTGEGLQTFRQLLANICPKHIEIPVVGVE
ncbi:MAG: succinate dehydrogenase/fumarate reductase iron-sulfur subunit [Bacillota bacterium]